MTPILTVGITTRDRPESLKRCIESLAHIAHLRPEIIVFDDASRTELPDQLRHVQDMSVRVIRNATGAGYIAGRNQIVREARSRYVLLLDDDASLMDGESIDNGIDLLQSNAQAGAVAFAQTTLDGQPWGDDRPAAVRCSPCYVPAYLGFAHLLRRDVFLALGGYRDRFEFYGEEKEYCLRLLEAGYRTVYLPGSRVAHEPDPSGRNRRRYLRYVTRNDALHALYNEPMYRLVWVLPARLLLYFRMRRVWRIDDPFGWAWVLRELRANLSPVLRERKPVSTSTLRLWRQLGRNPSPVWSSRERPMQS